MVLSSFKRGSSIHYKMLFLSILGAYSLALRSDLSISWCVPERISNGTCEAQCNDGSHEFDGGDCCDKTLLGNKICNP